MLFKIVFAVAVWLLFVNPLKAVDNNEQELSRSRSILEQLKSEINRIQEQISQTKNEESSLTQQIALIDRKMALTSRARGLLERERTIISREIDQSNKNLEATRQQLQDLKDLYARRAVYSYKFGRIKNIQLILSSVSFNQALIRYRYLKLIAENDERTIRSIARKESEIVQLKQKLDRDLALKEQNLQEKQREERRYLASKSDKNSLLKKLRWTQTTYQEQLALKERERQRLVSLIAELERKRQRQEQTGDQPDYVDFDFDDFAKARGKLPWPVKGKVITKYGRLHDPNSKTTINNTDIEIQSTLGTPVRNVFTGVVRIITYLPGYGNTVIIDHGKGFYTVYSHLDEIYVQKDDFIRTGEVIATVGESGSLSGSKLQFGIYGAQRSYDPQQWLIK